MASYRLHYMGISHWCVSAKKMLEFKKIPFTIVPARYDDREDLLKVSGQDYVPYLETGAGEGVAWHGIPDALEKAKPTPTLFPGGSAIHKVLEDWAHSVVEEAVWKYVCADAPKTFVDPRERWVFVEMQERKRGPLEVMALRKPEFLGGVKAVCALAEGLLADREFLTGNAPGLADIALHGSLAPLAATGNAIPAEYAKLRRWDERVAAL